MIWISFSRSAAIKRLTASFLALSLVALSPGLAGYQAFAAETRAAAVSRGAVEGVPLTLVDPETDVGVSSAFDLTLDQGDFTRLAVSLGLSRLLPQDAVRREAASGWSVFSRRSVLVGQGGRGRSAARASGFGVRGVVRRLAAAVSLRRLVGTEARRSGLSGSAAPGPVVRAARRSAGGFDTALDPAAEDALAGTDAPAEPVAGGGAPSAMDVPRARRLLHEGNVRFTRGNFKTARDRYEGVIAQFPRTAAAAVARQRVDEMRAAEELIDGPLHLVDDRQSLAVLSLAARMAGKKQKHQEQADLLHRIAAEHPLSAFPALEQAAELHAAALGDPVRALGIYLVLYNAASFSESTAGRLQTAARATQRAVQRARALLPQVAGRLGAAPEELKDVVIRELGKPKARVIPFSRSRAFWSRLAIGAVTIALSAVLSVAVSYQALNLGMTASMGMVATLVASGLLSLPALGGHRARLNTRDVGLMEATINIAAGLGYMAAALAMLAMLHVPVSLAVAAAWLGLVASLGVLLAIPLRPVMTTSELSWPTGQNVGGFMRELADGDRAGRLGAVKIAFGAAVVNAGVFVSQMFKWIAQVWTVDSFGLKGFALGVEPSLMTFSMGTLFPLRGAIWSAAASLVMWGAVGSYLIHSGVGQETAGAFGLLNALRHGEYFKVLSKWVMFPAAALVLSNGMASMLLRGSSFLSSLRSLATLRGRKQQDIPMGLVGAGIAAAAAALAALQFYAFGIPVWLTLAALVAGFPLVVVVMRTEGEIGLSPISAMASLMPILCGLLLPGSPLVVLAVPLAVVAGLSLSAAYFMNDLKTAELAGAKPRDVLRRYLSWGIPLGAVSTAFVFSRLSAKVISGDLAAPGARVWGALVQVMGRGTSVFSHSAAAAVLAAVVVGAVVALYDWLHGRREDARKAADPSYVKRPVPPWVPHASGIWLGLSVPGTSVLSMAAGGFAKWAAYKRWGEEKGKLYYYPLMAGIFISAALQLIIRLWW